ncbi:MAG: type II secretion system F family protein [Verrucomicrobiota bacterium]
MSSFEYQVLQKDGSLQNGTLAASTRAEAMRRLHEKGMQVISLEEDKSEKRESKKGQESRNIMPTERPKSQAPSENRLPSKHLIQFTEEISDLLSAGVQLDAALQSIAKRSESEPIRRVAQSCYERVRDGVPFANALRASSPSFSELYLNLVSAGEVSGALGDILKRQVAYLTTLAELRGKLATAMVYPAFLILSGVGVALMFTFFLIPRLQRLVQSTGGELPWVASAMLGAGDFLKESWILLLVVLAIVLVVGVVLFQKESTKRLWDEKKLKILSCCNCLQS